MSLLDTASLIVTPNGYKEGTLYSVIPSDGSGDMSVTRATTATRMNSAGLVELVPYNLVRYSQEISNTSFWAHYLANLTANTTTAPDGTTTADTIAITGASGSAYQFVTYSGGIHTLSCYFKKINEDNVYMDGNSSSGYYGASFNLTTQAITLFGGGFLPSIESVGNGWYRCSVQANGSGSGSYGFGVYASGGQSAYIWGAQLNEGTIKPYQKTETRLNIPRLDYSNGTCPSILVEPQRTNLLTYSNDFSNANWIKITTTVTPNYAVSPDGNTNASRVQFTAPSSQLYQPIGIQSSSVSSFYVKGTAGQTIAIYNSFNGGGLYELRTLTGQWQRIEVVSIGSISSFSAISNFFGATATEVLIYGAQFEIGSYSTSYIPTTSASVTRNADVVSKTGISSFFGTNQGTIFCDFIAPSTDTTNSQYIFDVSDGSNSTVNRLAFYKISSNQYQLFTNTDTTITINQNTRNKVAIVWNGTNVKIYANGSQQASITYANTNPSKINLGSRFTNAEYGNVYFNASATWATALTNTQLAQLTTI